MEWTALGGATALTELFKLLKSGIEICHSIWNAPKELQEAALHHSLLCDEVALFVRRIRGARRLTYFTDEDAHLLARYVRHAQRALAQIENSFAGEVRAPSFANRVRRGFLGKKKIAFLMTRLTRIETSINLALQLVSMKLDQMRFERLFERLELRDCCRHAHHADYDNGSSEFKEEPKAMSPPRTQPLLTSDQIGDLKSELRIVRSHASAIAYRRPLESGHTANLGLTLFNGMYNQLQMGALPTKSIIVSHDSDIMVASRAGDVHLMSQIIGKTNGVQHSRTLGNLTPMSCAIESGSIAAVQLLLNCNVHVDSTFGKHDTTALGAALNYRQLEIARLLISAGASFSCRNVWGWTPMFYLWSRQEPNLPASEFLKLLWSHPDFHLLHKDVYDAYGWGVVHRAAIYGAAEDLSMLVAYGLDPFQKRKRARNQKPTHHDDWSVLQLVIYHGVLGSFKQLLPYYLPTGGIEMWDSRGWTLLHIAVERGHIEIIRSLLEEGANSNAKTRPTLSGLPGDTTEHRYTPLSLAAEVSPEYLEEVRGLIDRTKKRNTKTHARRSSTIPHSRWG